MTDTETAFSVRNRRLRSRSLKMSGDLSAGFFIDPNELKRKLPSVQPIPNISQIVALKRKNITQLFYR
ncbi:hypothetical protein Xbed_02924 [Xenorhabdus beddingii]|uniref:Uncharacterized protein n=1 Tax=Xenorhabdus beddingii TaxID=40578 RepID=A0A1Y2SMF9_9GAMM|nr:hypothetical protein Xbed_02924 [Xenorhabdus beddingii]